MAGGHHRGGFPSLVYGSVWVWDTSDPDHGTVHDAGAKKRRCGGDEPFIL